MFNKATYLAKIIHALTTLAHEVENKNKLFLTDDNKWSENFFKDLLNHVCGYKLVNLNTLEPNYAGIDLGDPDNRICVQITASNTSEKIKETLATSDKHKRYEDYDTPIVLIIGYKKNYTKVFSTKFSKFDVESCIWDIQTLLGKIHLLNADQMKWLADFIDTELAGVVKIDPTELLDEDIALMIDLLFEYAQKELKDLSPDPEKKYVLVKREEGFISRKNIQNNVGELLFNSEIRQSLQYDKKIEVFLGNPINSEYQKKYFAVTDSFQKKYSEMKDELTDIGSLFGFVFDQVINYKNRKNIDDSKLLILLHNMYFNCDIGHNPE